MTSENNDFTVLVVDDDPSVRMLVPNLLRSEGFLTLIAANGQEGVQQAIERKPDLILLDINMPEMNGLDACQALKAAPETAEIPVIFMTSLGNDVDRLKGFEVGGEDYVIKPLNHLELLARMKRFVEAKNQPDVNLDSLSATARECVDVMKKINDDEVPAQLRPVVNRLHDELQGVVRALG